MAKFKVVVDMKVKAVVEVETTESVLNGHVGLGFLTRVEDCKVTGTNGVTALGTLSNLPDENTVNHIVGIAMHGALSQGMKDVEASPQMQDAEFGGEVEERKPNTVLQ